MPFYSNIKYGLAGRCRGAGRVWEMDRQEWLTHTKRLLRAQNSENSNSDPHTNYLSINILFRDSESIAQSGFTDHISEDVAECNYAY